MRLDHYLASSSGLSRKEARHAIVRGRAGINGATCRKPGCRVLENDQVQLDGLLRTLPEEIYLMMNKPEGVISATHDSSQPTALDLLPAELAARVHIAGRLDKDTTGLLLLTSDGQWSHRVTSPKQACPKTYRVTLASPLSDSAWLALEQGVQLHGEQKPTRPAQVMPCSGGQIELTIHEGRYHQIKRMLAAVGNHVEALHRLQIGNLALDNTLGPGQFRALSQAEIEAISH